MSLGTTIYNALFRKSSTFALTIIVGAFMFESVVENVSDSIFRSMNKGKLWDDIKDKYEPKE